jgi:class 3 adenylate cyclase
MFTDMVGYTTLAQRDESTALRMLMTQNQLLRPIFSRYGGTEVKTMGDAFLVEFDSALEATKCSIEMQKRSYSLELGFMSETCFIRKETCSVMQ